MSPGSSLAELAEGMAAGRFSSEEITRDCLDRITGDHADGNADGNATEKPGGGTTAHNALITVDAEGALAAARAADARRAAGDAGPLNGIPLLHKDNFCTAGIRTSCGSRILDNFVPPYDATVVSRLAAAGMVTLGKTNMDEFAMGSSTQNSYYGPTRNPWDPRRVPGGSSGGSAAAVAAGLAPAATGTDTGGSIRQPAALCGVTGLKPTYGRVSRSGMVAFASSLDQGGPLARGAADCALLLGAMAGLDPADSTSSEQPVEDYRATLEDSIEGLRIGIPAEYLGEGIGAGLDPGIEAAVREALAVLESLGARLVDISLPHTGLAISAYYVIACSEASTNLSRYDGVRYGHRCESPRDLEDLYTRTREEGFGAEAKRRILVGAYALSEGYVDAYYNQAQRVRRLVRQDFTAALSDVDLIAGPTTPHTAWRLDEKLDDPVAMYLEDVYTLSANLAGLPALSMPAGFSAGLPVGLQLIGGYFQEARLLNVAHRFQQATDWHRATPPAGSGAP